MLVFCIVFEVPQVNLVPRTRNHRTGTLIETAATHSVYCVRHNHESKHRSKSESCSVSFLILIISRNNPLSHTGELMLQENKPHPALDMKPTLCQDLCQVHSSNHGISQDCTCAQGLVFLKQLNPELGHISVNTLPASARPWVQFSLP